ncbi:MAG: class I SAM-dependent methyltransferase [Gammaproteobacteria bacterium]|nr:class I SAM-dependent methyltransferase [Gammaproteobacteria bacterium]NIR97748.1 class I SAM-dependent methyltransferase [Gammaproteobacteria bacterium]NIT63458.1 class I SAM-dependent methyltransferase [Gammaproteobacteria bacterium]NIV20390.1 class I SAM-dependent methyltransferase [Gammaproteobacteria bacterium]NIX10908.1 class I SAM-dependent methyltransferase [Gammaproteobacteria bacterium]
MPAADTAAQSPPRVTVIAAVPGLGPRAEKLAAELGLAVASTPGTAQFVLAVVPDGKGYRVQLQQNAGGGAGPVWVELARGTAAHRLRYGGGRGQPLARACGLKKGATPSILDATSGLGRDAFVLASLGCAVTVVERSPVIAALLADGLRRAAADPATAAIVARMELHRGDARRLLASLPESRRPDVVYLDPMYPHRTKSALIKKEMRAFRALVGPDPDAPELLAAALGAARRRVTVKRPRLAPPLRGPAPSAAISSKNTRYDVYTRHPGPGPGTPPHGATGDGS